MNKWQIICPLVAMLIVAMVAAYLHGQSQERGMRDAIERHLGSVLSELERRGESRRFPLAQAAQGALQDEAVSKRVHITSLFGTDDLYYNPTRPDIGSGALVLCANVRGALWAIQADRKVRHLTEAELQQAHLVSLASAVATSRAEQKKECRERGGEMITGSGIQE